jgi:hypothetical protein
MKNNLFFRWEYDSIQCKPRVRLTRLGMYVAVIATITIALPLIYAHLVGFAILSQ